MATTPGILTDLPWTPLGSFKTFPTAAAKKLLLLFTLIFVYVLCADSNPVPKNFGNTIPTDASFPSLSSPPTKLFRYFPPNTGPQTCCLIKEVPKGHFFLRIFFGVVFHDQEPLFAISIEGSQIFSLQSGWTQKENQEFVEAMMVLKDGATSLCFHGRCDGAPAILKIEMHQIDEEAYSFGPNWSQEVILRTATRLDCGANEPIVENYNGNHMAVKRIWEPIRTFSKQSDRVIYTDIDVKFTRVSPNFYPEAIYQSALVGTESLNLTYSMDLFSNGNHSIWFHFAEINGSIGVGERIFDILVNDVPKLEKLDIFRLTGGPYTALVLHLNVNIIGSQLRITFQPRQGSVAMISAIEVFEILPIEVKTSREEVITLGKLKKGLMIPLCHGWNGADPCAPQQHSWNGVNCKKFENNWVIDALILDNLGLVGFLPNLSPLKHLRSINISGNNLYGPIPASIGTITELEVLDLSCNLLSGSIPESLGQLKSLRILNLNGNALSGRVPAALHNPNFNGNTGLRPARGSHHSLSFLHWIILGAALMIFVIGCFLALRWRTLKFRVDPPYVSFSPNIEIEMNELNEIEMNELNEFEMNELNMQQQLIFPQL